MSHTLVLTKIQQTVVELSDEEYDEQNDLYELFDDLPEMDTVERSIEEI
jgi:hypothetical protein